MSDEELKDLIQQSSPPPPFPLSFQRDVWQSIAASETRSLSALVNRLGTECLQLIVRPSGALATVVTMLIIGAGLGGLVSTKDTETSLKAAYRASINPILSAHVAFEK